MMLDTEKMLAEASAQIGSDDFGDDSFREPFEVLVQALNTEARLHAEGMRAQHARIVGILAGRLQLQTFVARYPEIRDEVIVRPAVIAGLPRTGSTLLHRVLASDSRFYAPLWYEVRFPSPATDWDFTVANDARIPRAKAEVQAMLDASPALAAIHPMDALAPDEEILLLENSFYSTVPPSGTWVPTYSRWVAEHDNTPGYEYLKLQLQFLQWQKKKSGVANHAERWLLKAPHHLHYMDTLLKIFPDATIVQTHRDPVETIPSICSFMRALYVMASDHVDAGGIADEWSAKWANGLAHTMAVRVAFGGSAQQRFLDVYYVDSIDNPDAEIERVYEFTGLQLTAEARAAMAQWRDANRRELRPSHDYVMADYGLTEAGIKQQFADYREVFFA